MIASHVHDAIAQVRKLQELVLARSMFEGYSGKARLLSGGVAILTAAGLSSGRIPDHPAAHLAGWGAALAIALLLNYSALAWWFLFNPAVRRSPRQLKPALDALPALAVGAALSLALVLHGQHQLLFGVWMCLYGLAQVAYRQSLPEGIYFVGLAYLLAGAFCLLNPSGSFLNPWPMGLVFGTGETLGGAILVLHDHARQQPGANNP